MLGNSVETIFLEEPKPAAAIVKGILNGDVEFWSELEMSKTELLVFDDRFPLVIAEVDILDLFVEETISLLLWILSLED